MKGLSGLSELMKTGMATIKVRLYHVYNACVRAESWGGVDRNALRQETEGEGLCVRTCVPHAL